ncbi:MAG: tRNA dihydrouridine synthase DusB [Oscillospiraceae bacterium]|nr:tRNA dihydrouridine synthase DusB [Oscillospiraceae bacterium]
MEQYTQIGNVRIKKTAVLAPMASVSDTAYRLLNKEFGASLVYSEMVSAKAVTYMDKKTFELCKILPQERPFALQLFGSEPQTVALAAKLCMQFSPDIIDINMGCPVPKVAGNGCGSALMKNPHLAAKIICACKESVDIPITAKIRAGWDDNSINAVEMAQALEAAGVDAIAVHGRTKTQMYSGKSDINIIKSVKQAVSVPVIGNGDVKCAQDCIDMYSKTGCDLVMVARGSYGNPWIFRSIDFIADGKDFSEPTLEERLETMLYHFSKIIEFKGEAKGMHEARKHAAWYITGEAGAAKFRARCYTLSSYNEAKALADEYLKYIKSHCSYKEGYCE